MPRSAPSDGTLPSAPLGSGASGALTLYAAGHAVALPVLFPLVALHPRLRGDLRHRVGLLPRLAGEDPVWLHGSSAGDVMALAPVARALNAGGARVIITAWTRSGVEMARRQRLAAAAVAAAPLDLSPFVRAALRRVRPRALVLECLELWPALVAGCQRRGVPVIIINGRLSARSLARYRAARVLFEPLFRRVHLISALSAADAQRFASAGVPEQRIVTGTSTKHGGLILEEPAPARLKLVLGSIHAEEEGLLFPQLRRLLGAVPALEIVVAPRYPHRARRVLAKLRRHGVDGTLARQRETARAGQVVAIDVMGLLGAEYAGARAAFVGGSIVPRGGHNVLEPAALGVPVLVGPHTESCAAEAAALIQGGGALVVRDGETFYREALRLLEGAEPFAAMRRGARQVAAELRASAEGATWVVTEALNSLPGRGRRGVEP